MQKQLTVFLIFACLALNSRGQQSYNDLANNYITQFKDAAIEEQLRSGVPAAITLGQGILETQAGASELCTNANNHFGIKCKKEWTGDTYTYTDDHPDECFRKYSCARDSYKDHSDYLKTSKRYASLFELRKDDYKGWAAGLKRCGYATNPHYAQQLIKIIEDFHLQDYTYTALNEKQIPKAGEVIPSETIAVKASVEKNDAPQDVDSKNDKPKLGNGVFEKNGLRAINAHKGDVLLEQAIKYNIRYAKLLEYNDLPDAPLETDMIIYLEKKHTKGNHEEHLVKDGETLNMIAQEEGIQLKELQEYNLLKSNESPAEGEVLNLQHQVLHKPSLSQRTRTAAAIPQEQIASSDEYIYKKKDKANEQNNREVAQIQHTEEAAIAKPAEDQEKLKETVAAKPVEKSESGKVTEQEQPKKEEQEPQDDFAKLKAKLDKVVYAPANEEASGNKNEDQTATATVADPLQSAKTEAKKYYTVQKGDTGFSIAKKHHISMKELRDWNHLDFQSIKVGQKLIVKQ